MDLGEIKVEQLSEGFFELFEDGHFQKMERSRLKNLQDDPNLGTYTSAVGIDPVLIQNEKHIIVADPGLGWGLDSGSRHSGTSNIRTNLDIFGLKPEDVDFVVLTHLHFDHVAGSTYVNEYFQTTPTFPNARYIVHQDEWNFALQQIDLEKQPKGAGYQLDELYRLIADGRIHMQKGDLLSISDGIQCIKTGGHTPGHMILRLTGKKEIAYYLGDLLPAEYHLNHYSMRQMDIDPNQAKKAKSLLLRQALRENAIIFFYHSLFKKAGQLSRDRKKGYVLKDI